MSYQNNQFILLLIVSISLCLVPVKFTMGADTGAYFSNEDSNTDTTLNQSGQKIRFSNSCVKGDSVTIAAVGDVLMHGRLQRQAYGSDSGFVSLWKNVRGLLEQAEITYANLEGTVAPGINMKGVQTGDTRARFDDWVYSGYPMFNSHSSLLDDLKMSGFDVVSTANNHSLDRRDTGLRRTLEELKRRKMVSTGTLPGDDDFGNWWAVTEANGIRVAWLGCTTGTNGIAPEQTRVLRCYQQEKSIKSMVNKLHNQNSVDVVVVTPHWGEPYETAPTSRQKEFARSLLDTGAMAVLGSHPHVIQTWEHYETKDGRETFIMYSLANFVSGQVGLDRQTTVLLFMGLTKTSDGTRINGVRYVPAYMDQPEKGTLTLVPTAGQKKYAKSQKIAIERLGRANLHVSDRPIKFRSGCN